MTQTVYAASHITGNFSNPGNALGNTPSTWAGVLNQNSSYTSRWSMAAHSGFLEGQHTINYRVRKGTNSGNPTVQVNVYVDGSLHTSGPVQTVTSTSGQVLSRVFTYTGSGVISIEVVMTGTGGSGSARNSGQLAYLEAVYILGTDPNDPDPPPTDQAFYNFENDTVGQLPAGFALATGASGFAVSDAPVSGFGSKHLRLTMPGSPLENTLFVNFANGQQNVEMHGRCRIITGTEGYFHQFYMRALQNPAQQTYIGWHSRFGSTSFMGIDRYENGGWTAGPEGNLAIIPNTTTYRIEMRANGDTIDLRVWPEGTSRPANPLQRTGAGTQTGLFGLGAYKEGAVLAWDWVGVGINGATAPTEPVQPPQPTFPWLGLPPARPWLGVGDDVHLGP